LEDNLKLDLQELLCGGMEWIELQWRELLNAVMKLWFPLNAGNFVTSWEPVSLSRRTLPHGVSKCYLVALVIWMECTAYMKLCSNQMHNPSILTSNTYFTYLLFIFPSLYLRHNTASMEEWQECCPCKDLEWNSRGLF
jgi:hypothetical protein